MSKKVLILVLGLLILLSGCTSLNRDILFFDQSTTGATATFLQSFTDGDLTVGILSVTHDLNLIYPIVEIYDDTNNAIIPDDILILTPTTLDLNVLNFTPISGTWQIRVR